MAKCEKCGKEYLDGTEHVCAVEEQVQAAPEVKKAEEEKPATPENAPQ